MEFRQLGRTNYKVSVIGFGGIPIQRLEEKEAIELIKTAQGEGINFIDTARGYANSEVLIGKAMEGMRDSWIIATKSLARDDQGMKADIEISLKNLRSNTIDLYQLHQVKSKEVYDQVMGPNGAYGALKEAQLEGKIKKIGITSHDLGVLEMAIETDFFSTIQFPYNIVERHGEKLFQRAKERNIGVIIMKPLAGGAIREGELALRFIVENPNISVVIPGIDHMDQVFENSRIGQEKIPLNKEERQHLEKLQKELGNTFCRRCGYCLPCPQEIDIPAQFLLEGYYTRYDLQDWAVERYQGQSIKASDCIKCGKCEPRCPYDLPIRHMLEQVGSCFK
ncbi:aldo/keto reductase [Alkaliphilus metalliredigens QYMF]|uniref:Aldo/keto reductase n=1 Tax=Alkaliphilus metalliredigens (strain QYMF) TaxID=293826 RepID=A6TVC6_ALKMQ|nr:aldo/keto reductase [Alkaliphilus metalliredigens]ABR50144.1 aldo/keto reductase [Alkaliphilus metalliredigens QYMF]